MRRDHSKDIHVSNVCRHVLVFWQLLFGFFPMVRRDEVEGCTSCGTSCSSSFCVVSTCVWVCVYVCVCLRVSVCVSASDSVPTCLCVCVSVLECLCVCVSVCVYHSPPICHLKFRPQPLLAKGCSCIYPAHPHTPAPTHPHTVEFINWRTSHTHTHITHTSLAWSLSVMVSLSLSLSLYLARTHALSLPSYIHGTCLSLYVRLWNWCETTADGQNRSEWQILHLCPLSLSRDVTQLPVICMYGQLHFFPTFRAHSTFPASRNLFLTMSWTKETCAFQNQVATSESRTIYTAEIRGWSDKAPTNKRRLENPLSSWEH